jgi:peptidoglycan/xylan/chitin deacetylase (PgdA/CDA1 family)
VDDGFSATGGSSHPLVRPEAALVPGGPSSPVRYRRRRAAALAAVAVMSLLVGAVVGAASRAGDAVAHAPPVTASRHVDRIKGLARARAGSFAAAEARAESAALKRTLSYTPYVRIAGAQHREVALTFDDGPGPYTPDIVRQLQRLHAPATFFAVGIEERYFHAATAAIVARGYPIGDHTELHAAMSSLSRRDQRSELLQEAKAIGHFGAPFPHMFRPPYGLWNATTLSLLRKYRMLMVLWSVDTSDYLRPGVGVIVRRAIDGARPGAIILLHDAGGNRSQTVAALPRIVRGLRARGYRLVTVPRLLLDNPAPHDQNVAPLHGGGG